MANFPFPELVFNSFGILLSVIALYYWVQLFKKFKKSKNEFTGFIWFFTAAFSIMLLNLASTYIILVKTDDVVNIQLKDSVINFNNMQVLEVLSRTMIVFSMTIGVYILYSPLKRGLIYTLSAVELKMQEKAEKKQEFHIDGSASYLIQDSTYGKETADRSSPNVMKLFMQIASQGHYGFIVTREYPIEVRKNWNVDSLPIIGLTTSKEGEELNNVQYMDPHNMVELSHAIKDFISKNERSVIIIDGLEYLIIQNNFNDVLRFIESINDFISKKKAVVIIPLDFKAVSESDLHLLKRELREYSI